MCARHTYEYILLDLKIILRMTRVKRSTFEEIMKKMRKRELQGTAKTSYLHEA